jgi:hypothetical protein
MTALSVSSFVPGGLITVAILACMVCGIVIFALHRKGDVRFVFLRGKTMFALEAKEKSK